MLLGLVLFYVGAVLILNGLWMLQRIGDSEIWVINLFVGTVSWRDDLIKNAVLKIISRTPAAEVGGGIKVSLRTNFSQLEEMMQERGGRQLADGRDLYQVKGVWKYLYRAVDREIVLLCKLVRMARKSCCKTST